MGYHIKYISTLCINEWLRSSVSWVRMWSHSEIHHPREMVTRHQKQRSFSHWVTIALRAYWPQKFPLRALTSNLLQKRTARKQVEWRQTIVCIITLDSLNCVWVQSRLNFPGGPTGKEPACQCRRCKRCRFDPWVGKIPWKRAWLPTPVFLPGESHGQRDLVGYSPWGLKEWDTTEAT